MANTADYEALEDKKLISEFNEAKFQILRVNYSWSICNSHRRIGNLEQYQYELDNISDEIIPKANEIDKSHEKKIILIDQAINKANPSEKGKYYALLRLKHRTLKQIQEQIGMGGRLRELDQYDMDE